MPASEPWIDDVLRFWFEELRPQAWFVKDRAVDDKIRTRYEDLYESFKESVPRAATTTARGALAAVIVLDQFPRNMFRKSPKAFQTDALALQLAESAIRASLDQQLTTTQRAFLYMPFQHSENREVQARSVELFRSLGEAQGLDYAQQHKDIIDRFGRFPHRNTTLGRASTPEEVEFLKGHPGF